MKYLKPLLIVLAILFFDQFFKVWVKTHMELGENIYVFGNWFILHFTENNGIAFGIEFFGRTGKIFLTLFRILAAILICYYILKLIKKDFSQGFIISLCLIFVGAIGNILDSVFYGIIFDYEKIFYGKVVDMLYFPVIRGYYPDWFPFMGGNRFIFFRPVFNVADSAITTGVFSILIFYRKYLRKL